MKLQEEEDDDDHEHQQQLQEQEEEEEGEEDRKRKKRKAKDKQKEERCIEEEEPPQEDAKPIGEPVRVSGKGRGRRKHYESFEFDGNQYILVLSL